MTDILNNILMGFVCFYITSIFLGIAYWVYLICAYDKERAWSFFIKFVFYIHIFVALCCAPFSILMDYSIMKLLIQN